jgi:hypothetical protein
MIAPQPGYGKSFLAAAKRLIWAGIVAETGKMGA